MKRFRYLFLLYVLLSPPAFGGAAAIESDVSLLGLPEFRPTKDPLPVAQSGIISDISSALSFIPSEKLQCVNEAIAGTLFQKVQGHPDEPVWKSNSGVKASYQLMMAKSPCLATLTSKYYDRITSLDKNVSKSSPDRLPGSGRPALNAVVGQGSFAGNDPGYALDEAVALTKGRKALAMAMIGYCGHDDDQNSMSFTVDLSNPKSRYAVLRHFEATAAKSGLKVDGGFDKSYEQLRKTIETSERASISLACPKNTSSFYAAQALGKNADISAEVRSYVSRIQAPNKGPGALPGKAYHVGFAAVMGCRLTTCGLSKESSQKVLALIANRYRTVRQSQASQKYDDIRLLIEERFDLNWSDERALKSASPEIAAWIESEAGKKAIMDNGGGEFVADNRAKMTWEMWKTNIDTAILDKGGLQGKTFYASRFSEGRDPYWDPKTVNKPQQSFCPGWSEERCNNARKKYETYGADFDWTEEQQKAGAAYGAEVCKQEKVHGTEALEKQACEALDDLNKSSSSGTSGTSGTSKNGIK